MSEIKPLPCIVCGFQPESVDPNDGHRHVPSGATMFKASGHYGSTVWDPMSGSQSLTINVCDSCLTRRAHRVTVMAYTRRDPDVQYAAWDPES